MATKQKQEIVPVVAAASVLDTLAADVKAELIQSVRNAVARTLEEWEAERRIENLLGATVDNMIDEINDLATGCVTAESIPESDILEVLEMWVERREPDQPNAEICGA